MKYNINEILNEKSFKIPPDTEERLVEKAKERQELIELNEEIDRIFNNYNCIDTCDFKKVASLTLNEKEEKLISFLTDLENVYKEKSLNPHYIAERSLNHNRDKYLEMLEELESYLNRNEIKEDFIDIFEEVTAHKVIRVKEQTFKFRIPK